VHDDRRSEAADDLLARLRSGDETAFARLVDELNGPLLALARTFTPSRALAEDIVQETWLAAIRGLSRFEGRSALRTWIYGILVRRARTLAARETRQRAGEAKSAGAPAEAWRFGSGRRGLWEEAPVPWALDDPASIHEGEETLRVVSAALDGLPERQRQVVHLRDVEGLEAQDVCNILRLSETNQRVLLHRGRAAIRRALDRHLRAGSRLRSLGLVVALALSMVGGGP
jgi:RNA polymerase sigma-70 factor, ECF subfamily